MIEEIIKILESNYDLIITEYKHFESNLNLFILSDNDNDVDYQSWNYEYHTVCKITEQETSNSEVTKLVPIKKFDYWYGYIYNDLILWDTFLVAHRGKNYIHPTQYGKKYFNQTYNLLKKFKQIKRVTIANLHPTGKIPLHVGKNDLQKIHLGLVVPPGDIKFKVKNEIISWEEGKCFIFNDCDAHMAWNNSEYDRIVLIIDIDREYI